MNPEPSQFFKDLVSKPTPLGDDAVIFLEIQDGPQSFEEALRLLRTIKGFMDDYELVRAEYPLVMKVCLQPHEAREAVIRLTECGFASLKAFYPVK